MLVCVKEQVRLAYWGKGYPPLPQASAMATEEEEEERFMMGSGCEHKDEIESNWIEEGLVGWLSEPKREREWNVWRHIATLQ